MWNGWGHPGMVAGDGAWYWGLLMHGPFSLLLWILVIAAVVMLVRYLWRGDSSTRSGDLATGSSALGILEERYARGEIGKDEFLEKKRDLS